MVSIALLTTGDEVIEGDILNSNSQKISQQLTDAGFTVDLHQSCRDDELTIQESMGYLLECHDVIIITGGLGPTVDDRTRFALSFFLDKPLEFHEPTWQWIVDRYQRLQVKLPETNRQQALFPNGSNVIPNDFGSADGAFIQSSQGLIFMLPGPPRECFPMISTTVIPELQKRYKDKHRPILKWRVFGISESALAQNIKEEFGALSEKIGYRWHYPYIDVKYRALDIEDENTVNEKVSAFLAPLIVCPPTITASEFLRAKLISSSNKFCIDDDVTGGRLQQLLLTTKTCQKLCFNSHPSQASDIFFIRLTGLEAYWQGVGDLNHMQIVIEYVVQDNILKTIVKLDYEPLDVLTFVTELVSVKLLNILGL